MGCPKFWFVATTFAAAAFTVFGSVSVAQGNPAAGPSGVRGVDCSNTRFLCAEVANSDEAFGHYVGHDEPSLLFDSTVPGSGNQMRYSGILPKEPSPINVAGKHTYDFQLYATFWFGMALCDTQSYPNTVKSCVPDSDANIAPAGSPFHPGTAFMELQFYPPGYAQQFDGFSCSGTQWCVAMTIDSYAANPLTGQLLNKACASKVGIEPVNFAYLTRSGKPQGPPNPVDFDPIGSGKPDPRKVAFLNPGDRYSVTLHDTEHGLETIVKDTSTGGVGKMTASAANGFGQVRFAPTAAAAPICLTTSTRCTPRPPRGRPCPGRQPLTTLPSTPRSGTSTTAALWTRPPATASRLRAAPLTANLPTPMTPGASPARPRPS